MMENTLLGIAIGDAFGLGIEMRDRNWIAGHVDFTKYVSVRTGRRALFLGRIDQLDSRADKLSDIPTDEYQLLVGPQTISEYEGLAPFVGLSADAMRTAGTALYLLKHCTSSFEALQRAILIGGDVDSLAAIVVGIAGGRYGLQDMPEFLFDQLENREGLKEISREFAEYLSLSR